VIDYRLRHYGDQAFEHREIDVAAFAALPLAIERDLQRKRDVDAADGIRQDRAEQTRRAARVSGDLREPAERVHGAVEPAVVRPWSGLTEGARRQIDQAR